MVRAAAAIIASLALPLETTRAGDEACGGGYPVKVSVNAFPLEPINFDLAKTIGELTQLSNEAAEPTIHYKGPALGFYRANAGFTYSVKADGHGLATGGVCVVLKAIDIQFGIKTRHIMVAREIQDKPCIREFVLAHEHRHVATDQAVLSLYLSYLHAVLTFELSDGFAVGARAPNEARRLLKETVDQRLQRAIKEFSSARARAQLRVHAANDEQSLEEMCGEATRQMLESIR